MYATRNADDESDEAHTAKSELQGKRIQNWKDVVM